MHDLVEYDNQELIDFRDLEILREAPSYFPLNCCELTTAIVEERLSLPARSGFFLDNNGEFQPHFWNELPDSGEIVDYTVSQFLDREPEQVIFPKDSDLGARYFSADDNILTQTHLPQVTI